MKKKNKRKVFNKNTLLFIPLIIILVVIFCLAVNSVCELFNVHLFDSHTPDIGTIPQASFENGWNLILVNSDYRVPDDYEVEFTVLSNGEKVDKRIYPDLQDMMDDARADGLSLFIADGYRSYDTQEEVYVSKYNHYMDIGYSKTSAKQMTEYYVALPGTSEHQLGIGVDINAETDKCSKDDVYNWLYENSWKYGFIKRYPENKTKYTGIVNEPWHYRYVGKSAAKVMYEEELCLEEYIDTLI